MSVSAGQNDPTEREDELAAEAAASGAERQLLFTDAVIAIAITLLALELPVPEGTTNHDLLRAAWDDHTEYFSYVLSFVVIAAHWRAHRAVFQSVRGFGSRVGRLNLLWLFTQVTIPFATKVINGDGATGGRWGFYALIQGLACLILAVIVRQLTVEGDFRGGTRPEPARNIQRGLVGTAIAFLVSIPLFFVFAHAWLLWIVVPIANQRLDSRRRSRTAAEGT